MSRPKLKLDEVERAVHHMKTREAKVAIFILERYIEGAMNQWRRIQKSRDDSSEADLQYRISNETDLASRGRFWDFQHQALLDIHFYFICADKIQSLTEYICRKERGADLHKLWKKWWPKLKEFNTARNRFEHIHSYIQGNWKKAYFMMLGNDFRLKKEKFDLSSGGLKKLTDSFEELIVAFEARPLVDEPPANQKP